jgi:hypothetical protein
MEACVEVDARTGRDRIPSLHEIFGPFPAREDLTTGEQFRL